MLYVTATKYVHHYSKPVALGVAVTAVAVSQEELKHLCCRDMGRKGNNISTTPVMSSTILENRILNKTPPAAQQRRL